MISEITKLQVAISARAVADCLVSSVEVNAAYDRMAQAISARLRGSCPHFLIVLSGGMIPAVKLMSRLDFPLTMDYIHISRYRNGTTGGEVELQVMPLQPLKDRLVVIIDDILDEGATLAFVHDYCQQLGAAEVLSAVLVEKQHSRCNVGIKADFIGLQVNDRFLFGEGMDCQGYFRNLNGIYALRSGENG